MQYYVNLQRKPLVLILKIAKIVVAEPKIQKVARISFGLLKVHFCLNPTP